MGRMFEAVPRAPAGTALRMLGTLALVAGLAACASAPPPAQPEPVAAPQPRPVEEETAARTPEPEQPVNGRHTFRFDTMSVLLSEADKARLAGLAGQARGARAVTIRGSCDRNAVGNAKEAAVARALAVRNVLVQEGVPAARIRVRYSTDDGTHVAVLRFN